MSVLILDTNYSLHRAMRQPGVADLTTTDGQYTGGVYGLFLIVRRCLKEFNCSCCIMVWDGGHSKRRTDIYPTYKSRDVKRTPEDQQFFLKFLGQRAASTLLMNSLGVPSVTLPGKEADDVISFLCRHIVRSCNEHCIVVSDDKDMIQLVDDMVWVHRPIHRETVTQNNFQVITGISRDKWIIYRSMIGDPSDNIVGIKGVGEVAVKKILDGLKEPTWDDVVRVCKDNIKYKWAKNVIVDIDTYKRNQELIELNREYFLPVEISKVIEQCNGVSYDEDKLLKNLSDLEFNEAIQTLPKWDMLFRRLTLLKDLKHA